MNGDALSMIREELGRLRDKMDEALEKVNEHETEIRSVKYAARAIQWFLGILVGVFGFLGVKLVFDK